MLLIKETWRDFILMRQWERDQDGRRMSCSRFNDDDLRRVVYSHQVETDSGEIDVLRQGGVCVDMQR